MNAFSRLSENLASFSEVFGVLHKSAIIVPSQLGVCPRFVRWVDVPHCGGCISDMERYSVETHGLTVSTGGHFVCLLGLPVMFHN